MRGLVKNAALNESAMKGSLILLDVRVCGRHVRRECRLFRPGIVDRSQRSLDCLSASSSDRVIDHCSAKAEIRPRRCLIEFREDGGFLWRKIFGVLECQVWFWDFLDFRGTRIMGKW